MQYSTEQEAFWAGTFGDEYIERNQSQEYLAANLNFFSRALKQTGKPSSILEFGANIGMNLKAIKLLFPNFEASGIELNETAASQLSELLGMVNLLETGVLLVSYAEPLKPLDHERHCLSKVPIRF